VCWLCLVWHGRQHLRCFVWRLPAAPAAAARQDCRCRRLLQEALAGWPLAVTHAAIYYTLLPIKTEAGSGQEPWRPAAGTPQRRLAETTASALCTDELTHDRASGALHCCGGLRARLFRVRADAIDCLLSAGLPCTA